MKNERIYLSAEAFASLSDSEKQDYYSELGEERKKAFTYEAMSELSAAYGAMGRYLSAEHFAQDMKKAADEQLIKDKAFQKKRQKLGIVLISAVVACALIVALIVAIFDFRGGKKKSYEEAVGLYRDGKYGEALEIFNGLGDYEDSKLYVISINGMIAQGALDGQPLKVGATVSFGEWDSGNGKEELQWLVISVDSERKQALLLSVGTVYGSAYGSTDMWRDCELRNWLNTDFLDTAFDASEKEQIKRTQYCEYGEDENDVLSSSLDNVTLLSERECELYLTDILARKAEGAGYSEWWLRSSVGEGKAMYVTENGKLATLGDGIGQLKGVRPAMWVEFD